MVSIIPIEAAHSVRLDDSKRRGDKVLELYYSTILLRMAGSRTWDQSAYVVATRHTEMFPGPWQKCVMYPGTFGVRAANGRRVANFLTQQQADRLILLANGK